MESGVSDEISLRGGQAKAHRRLSVQSDETNSELNESSDGDLDSSDALHRRRTEEESQSLRESLDADEGGDGRIVDEGRKGEGSEGVVGERICRLNEE